MRWNHGPSSSGTAPGRHGDAQEPCRPAVTPAATPGCWPLSRWSTPSAAPGCKPETGTRRSAPRRQRGRRKGVVSRPSLPPGRWRAWNGHAASRLRTPAVEPAEARPRRETCDVLRRTSAAQVSRKRGGKRQAHHASQHCSKAEDWHAPQRRPAERPSRTAWPFLDTMDVRTRGTAFHAPRRKTCTRVFQASARSSRTTHRRQHTGWSHSATLQDGDGRTATDTRRRKQPVSMSRRPSAKPWGDGQDGDTRSKAKGGGPTGSADGRDTGTGPCSGRQHHQPLALPRLRNPRNPIDDNHRRLHPLRPCLGPLSGRTPRQKDGKTPARKTSPDPPVDSARRSLPGLHPPSHTPDRLAQPPQR